MTLAARDGRTEIMGPIVDPSHTSKDCWIASPALD